MTTREDRWEGGPPPDGPALIWVQHVMGVGHLNRAMALARGLAAAGRPVVLVSGGRPVPHLAHVDSALPLRLEQLPPLASADLSFSGLVDTAGAPVTDALWAARRARLEALATEVRPALLILEMYPFGRRPFDAEVRALIDAARAARPEARVVCSVRDILVRKDRPEKHARMLAAANDLIDLVLVHGDPALLPFSATFPQVDRLRSPVVHTGYLVAPPPALDGAGTEGTGEVLVSVGGGAMGRALLEAVILARPLCDPARGGALPWRVLVGGALGSQACLDLAARAAPGVVVEPARPDFRLLLGRARLSISQAGYNTVAETLMARVPALLVPWGEGTESEQRDRAAAMARLGVAQVLETAAPTPVALATAIESALDALPHPTPMAPVSLRGVARSVDSLLGSFRAHWHASAGG